MTTSQEPALDEIQWRSPALVQDFGGIHTNSVHHYFMQSPFFDQTSNNAVLRTQAQFNPAMYYLLQSREAFEERLQAMQGLQFVVVEEPKPLTSELGHDSGVWVIQKQVKRQGDDGKDEISVLGTYFVVGENIYQAPSIKDVIGSKVLFATTGLIKFLATASELPIFSSAEGYRYIPAASSKKGTGSASQQQEHESEMNSPEASIEQSTQPNSQAQSSANNSTVPANAPSSAAKTDTRLLLESMKLTQLYGSEYMDENPLQGEPGSFVFSSTNERLRARQQQQEKQQQEQAARAATASRTTDSQSVSAVSTPVSTADGKLVGQKGGKAEKGADAASAVPPAKPKRRKSKAPISPTSPDGAENKDGR